MIEPTINIIKILADVMQSNTLKKARPKLLNYIRVIR